MVMEGFNASRFARADSTLEIPIRPSPPRRSQASIRAGHIVRAPPGLGTGHAKPAAAPRSGRHSVPSYGDTSLTQGCRITRWRCARLYSKRPDTSSSGSIGEVNGSPSTGNGLYSRIRSPPYGSTIRYCLLKRHVNDFVLSPLP